MRPVIAQRVAAMADARFAQHYAAIGRPRIILGSSSSSRRSIMDQLASQHGFSYCVRTAGIDESNPAFRDPSPRTLVLKLARAKAAAIVEKLRASQEPLEGLLVTCDQVVTHSGNVLEKPTSREEAERFIDGYGQAPASTVGATVVSDLRTGLQLEDVDVCHIHFSPIPASTRAALIDEGEVFYCAGGLMVEHPLVTPHVTRMEGTQDAVMGLSMATVMRLLLQAMEAA